MPDLDPAAVVRVLNKHGVRFVVIGGIAAQLHDLPVPAGRAKDLEHLDRYYDDRNDR